MGRDTYWKMIKNSAATLADSVGLSKQVDPKYKKVTELAVSPDDKFYLYSPEVLQAHPTMQKVHQQNRNARQIRGNYPENTPLAKIMGSQSQIAKDARRAEIVSIAFPDHRGSTIDIIDPVTRETIHFQLNEPGKTINFQDSIADWDKLDYLKQCYYVNVVAWFISKRNQTLRDPAYTEKVMGITQGHVASILDIFNADFTYEGKRINTANAADTSTIVLSSFKDGRTEVAIKSAQYVLTLMDSLQYVYRTKNVATGEVKDVTTDDPEIIQIVSAAFAKAKRENNPAVTIEDGSLEILPLATISTVIEYTKGKSGQLVDDKYQMFTAAIHVDKLQPKNPELHAEKAVTAFFTRSN